MLTLIYFDPVLEKVTIHIMWQDRHDNNAQVCQKAHLLRYFCHGGL